MRFSSLVLPPARVKHQARPYLPGIYWPHAEDPREVPWRPTHRIHYQDRTGQAHAVEVMWVLDRDTTCTPDLYLTRRSWYGYERAQWVMGGTTGWGFARNREYDGVPHVLRYTPQGRTGLEMERIDHACL